MRETLSGDAAARFSYSMGVEETREERMAAARVRAVEKCMVAMVK